MAAHGASLTTALASPRGRGRGERELERDRTREREMGRVPTLILEKEKMQMNYWIQ